MNNKATQWFWYVKCNGFDVQKETILVYKNYFTNNGQEAASLFLTTKQKITTKVKLK